MSEITFTPATRENTPIIVGLGGPSKSGKTFSALRLATGLANGGKIKMINTEGKRGHQYADKFKYEACDLTEPYSMAKYKDVITEVGKDPETSVLIIDSMSHGHEGIGGMLDQHESELDRRAGNDFKKRDRVSFAAWARVKKDEAHMVNAMLSVNCHIILCFRAKEKLKIIKGKDPIPMGWQPIASDRIHFETAFTLILPPYAKGVPDMSAIGSEMRDPFDKMIKEGRVIDENLGKDLAKWAAGGEAEKPIVAKEEAQAEAKERDWIVEIRACKNMDDLKKVFEESPKTPDIIRAKDERKELLSVPENCPSKLEGCDSADMSGPLAVCVQTGAACPFEEEKEF